MRPFSTAQMKIPQLMLTAKAAANIVKAFFQVLKTSLASALKISSLPITTIKMATKAKDHIQRPAKISKGGTSCKSFQYIGRMPHKK